MIDFHKIHVDTLIEYLVWWMQMTSCYICIEHIYVNFISDIEINLSLSLSLSLWIIRKPSSAKWHLTFSNRHKCKNSHFLLTLPFHFYNYSFNTWTATKTKTFTSIKWNVLYMIQKMIQQKTYYDQACRFIFSFLLYCSN